MLPTTIQSLPAGFTHWHPVVQAGTLALMTFVQEDLPTIGASLLAAAGKMDWATGLLGCFLGIWLGDILLYALARTVGRPLLESVWLRRWIAPAAVARSEQWFARKGTWLLVSSRFVPGTRLPTYLAAGFLRLPFGRFVGVTGLAVGVWTVGIFGVAQLVGDRLLGWLRGWTSSGVAILLTLLAIVIVVRSVPKLGQKRFWQKTWTALVRWTRWEFWPPWLFYAPVAVYYLWLAIRYRSFTLPTAANPGMFSGGMVGESKSAILRDLSATSPEFTAEAHLLTGLTAEDRLAAFEVLRQRHHLDYPLILKPEVGQRGVGVKLVRTREQAAAYLQQTSAPLVLQRYADGPHELGVFYYRFPHEPRGRIFAITEKVFPTITGDGRHTIEELVWHDARARFMAGKYLQRLGDRRFEVLAGGERVRLVEAGNHAQGCIFRDGAGLGSEALADCIDVISRKLDGFFIGRYDLRYASEADLRLGRNFQIIELNGAASEATNIYDARNSLWSAYRTLFRQWELVFAIGDANRERGSSSTPLVQLWRKWRECSTQALLYPLAD